LFLLWWEDHITETIRVQGFAEISVHIMPNTQAMNNLRLSLLFFAMVLSACSANSRWLEGAMMTFEVERTAPKTYLLTANGAGAQSSAQVERGFLVRASELCDNGSFDHKLETVPYQYGDWNGYFVVQHRAYRTTGTVICK
jgi:hypothetical protein